MNYLTLFIGMAIGGIVIYFITSLMLKNKTISKNDFYSIKEEKEKLFNNLNLANAENERLKTNIVELKTLLNDLKNEIQQLIDANTSAKIQIAEQKVQNKALEEKYEVQKEDISKLQQQFKTEFENIANKILDENSKKFSLQNKTKLNEILKPLSDNIDNFRKKVEETYDKESKERFSLGREVEKLVELNKEVSQEAKNLTNALLGNSKTQGNWGEMILENILEQSGLQKDREYKVQEFIKDKDGNIIVNDEKKKMQPDVIIFYPDDRQVIIDSKVSLTAYSKFCSTDDKSEQDQFLKEHMISIKKHIDELSAKNYQDFVHSLDFTMMFVPNEPAYILALKEDANLWNYAYEKRILLISPTNLIAAIKLIEDLWKREYQNRNAMEIADRGAKLYDKFYNFLETFKEINKALDKAQISYDKALTQLESGNGNLIRQAEMLKELGVKAKKNLPKANQ